MITPPPVHAMPADQGSKRRILKRYESLKSERSAWVAVWKQQADYILPRRFRSEASQRNKPSPNEKLVNNTPTQAARTLAAGLMGGLTSPARPWFRLGLPNFQSTNIGATRAWLAEVEEILRELLIRSNIYNGLATIFQDLGTFSTAAMLIEEDGKDVVRSYVFPLGSFVLAASARGQIDTCIREVPMTVGQVCEQFGMEACSQRVRDAHRKGQLDDVVEVLHAIEPNACHDPERMGTAFMPWTSKWFEAKSDANSEQFLRVSGFSEFPVIAPRWNVTGTDTYGTGPGFDALGDAKALQLMERRKAQLIDRITNPPMVAPASLRAGRPSLLPGDVTYVDKVAGGQGFEPAITIHPSAIAALDQAIRQHEERIQTTYYVDLWLALTMDDRNQRATAREVAERHEEKLLTLGPVLERLHDEALDPLIARVFAIALRRGLIPEPPREIQGQSIKVEYISIMAAAQRLLGVAAVERLASFIGNLAGAKPNALDKLNEDQLVDDYAEMLGTSPKLLLTQEQVDAKRAQRAQAQAAEAAKAQAAATGLDMAKSAELLSRTDVNGTSALNRMLAAQGGGGGPLTGGAGLPVAP